MDIPFTIMEHIPRLHPSPLPVLRCGYLPTRQRWRRYAATSINASLILSGHGAYRIDGQDIELQTPCVISQWPDVPVAYGPHHSGDWEEFYINYAADSRETLLSMGLMDRKRPHWTIAQLAPIRRLLLELQVEIPRIQQAGVADRIDRLCERLLLETWIGAGASEQTPQAKAISSIRQQVQAQVDQPVDWQQLAHEHDLPWSSFRRWWLREVGIPPAAWLTRVRLQEAARYLIESDNPIGIIAERVGYPDPLHFSRRFKQVFGMSAREYRKRYWVVEE